MEVVVKEEKNRKIKGLTYEQVQEKIKLNKTNKSVKPPSKSTWEIVASNIFTYFNLIFTLLAVLLMLVGAYKDLTFLPVIIANTIIGIIQELRAKKVLDNLKMIHSPYTTVIRDGEETRILSSDLVKDDVVIFKAGDQICADAIIIDGDVAVNESLITGESDEVNKKKDDNLLSGSFIVSGKCYARLTNVGEESYISKLTIEAKKLKNGEQSEMIRSLNRLVKIAGIIIIPIGMALFGEQFFIKGISLNDSIEAMVAAVIGMIPEGLFLLASVTLAVSAMKLAKNKVLIHDMKSIETLARVDVLCVDKTGTITENNMKVIDLILLNNYNDSIEELKTLIGDFAYAQQSDNNTMIALKEYFNNCSNIKSKSISGFSSQYKYSGVQFENESYVMGAPEFILKDDYSKYQKQVDALSKKGERVLVFCKYNGIPDGKELNGEVIPYALITLKNSIREKAIETFKYFEEQGVEIKVISGDNPITVSEIAKEAKIKNAEKYIDASKLKNDADIEKAVKEYAVFGRVTPQQKRKIIKALKKQGRTVAMTGDGVNDVLALKDADCSVAMASGSQAAVQASQLVLIESDFSKMPGVVKEGRRVVNNLQCAGSLFLVKNIFSFFVAILSVFFSIKYPLKPPQVTLVAMFTIGIPAFLLAQAPNTSLIKGKFINEIIKKALPGGIADTILIITMIVLGGLLELSSRVISTASTVLIAMVGLIVLYGVCKPMNKYKWIVLLICTSGLALSMIFLKNIFAL